MHTRGMEARSRRTVFVSKRSCTSRGELAHTFTLRMLQESQALRSRLDFWPCSPLDCCVGAWDERAEAEGCPAMGCCMAFWPTC